MFKWLFGSSPPEENDVAQEYLTRSAAETMAQQEATRDLHMSEDEINYIGLLSNEYYRIRIVFDRPDHGLYTAEFLPLNERREGEVPTNEQIRTMARGGQKLDAVKMYRFLHNVDLRTAKAAIDKMTTD